MLTPNYMKKLPDDVVKYYRNLEDKILSDVVKDLQNDLELSGTSRGKLESLVNLNYDLSKIKKELNKDLDLTAYKLGQIVNKAGLKSYEMDKKAYEFGGKKLKNRSVLKMVDTMSKSSIEDLKNMSGTIGLAGKPLEKWYKETLNQGIIDITSGAYSRSNVMRKIVNDVGDKGLEFIEYQSGKNFSVEAAVKMNLVSTVNRLSAEISLSNAKEMDHDLMEITAHEGARPTHQDWQGQVVSLSGKEGYLTLDDIGFGDADGFMGVNCRHNWYPYFEGLSDKFWTDDKLNKINTFKYEEKTYTEEKAYQRLRNLERTARKHERKANLYDAVNDEEAKTIEKIKEQRVKQEHKKFEKVIKSNETSYNIFENIEAADKFHRPQTIEYWKKWTEEEKWSMYNYTLNSLSYNKPLRDGTPIQFDGINYLKDALDKTSLKENITVFRGVGGDGVKGLLNIESPNFFLSKQEILDKKDSFIGEYVVDNGFVSTGVNKAGGFAHMDYIYEIRCPKGTKGAYLEPFSGAGRSYKGLNWDGESYDPLAERGENEFLIQAGTPMKVIDILEEENKLKFILEVIVK